MGAPVIQGQAETGVFRKGLETSFIHFINSWWEGVKKMESDFSMGSSGGTRARHKMKCVTSSRTEHGLPRQAGEFCPQR